MNALGFPILSVLLAVPPAAALWILFAPGSEAGRAQNARVIALGATLIDFALGILLWLNFDSSTAAFQFQEDVPLFAPWFSWKLGIDGIALMLIQQIGRASCRERVCQYVSIWVVAGSLKKKTEEMK